MPARLFLALWPTAETLERLLDFRAHCQWQAGARLTPANHLHITLHFLGAVPDEQVPQLAAALTTAPCDVELELDTAETWGRGLAVLTARQLPADLVQMHSGLAEGLRSLQMPVESRPYRPHVTLARDAHGWTPNAEVQALQWRSSGYTLVESAAGQYRNVAVYR